MVLPLAGLVDDVDEPWPRIFGATLVLLVLTSGSAADPAADAAGRKARAERERERAAGSDDFLASAVIQIADKIDALNSDPGNRAPEIRAEVNRLRNLAQSFEN